jgi:hypothetical protein
MSTLECVRESEVEQSIRVEMCELAPATDQAKWVRDPKRDGN